MLLFEGLPCGIFVLIPDAGVWLLAALYSAVILLFGCGYVAAVNRLKIRKLTQLRLGRSIRDEISSNKKKIRVITRAIHRDDSEDPYHLDSYNYEIARLEAELEEVATRKQENLNTFEAVTKRVIADEIMESNKDRILKIQEEYRQLHQKLQEADKALRDSTMQVTGTYESYLGRDFLDVERVESLIQILESGKAANITEAIAVYKDSKI